MVWECVFADLVSISMLVAVLLVLNVLHLDILAQTAHASVQQDIHILESHASGVLTQQSMTLQLANALVSAENTPVTAPNSENVSVNKDSALKKMENAAYVTEIPS